MYRCTEIWMILDATKNVTCSLHFPISSCHPLSSLVIPCLAPGNLRSSGPASWVPNHSCQYDPGASARRPFQVAGWCDQCHRRSRSHRGLQGWATEQGTGSSGGFREGQWCWVLDQGEPGRRDSYCVGLQIHGWRRRRRKDAREMRHMKQPRKISWWLNKHWQRSSAFYATAKLRVRMLRQGFLTVNFLLNGN